MTHGVTSRLPWYLLALVPALLLSSPGSTRAADSAWKELYSDHQKSTPPALLALLKADGVTAPERLLAHPYLVRLELKGAGGGTAKHSEVIVRVRHLPRLALAKATNPGGPQPERAQVGALDKCTVPPNGVARGCPLHYNGKGFVDITSTFTDRNVLFVHDPLRKGQGQSVVWIASDKPQKFMWYHVVPKTSWPSWDFGSLTARKFELPRPEGPAPLPGNPPDPGAPVPRVRPGPTPPVTPPVRPGPTPPVTPPVRKSTMPGVVSGWQTLSTLHRATDRADLERRMRADGVPTPGYLLAHRFLVRVSLTNAGGGSASRTELRLELRDRPAKVLGRGWADLKDLNRAQIGAESRCRALPDAEGGPEGRRCPMHFNGIGWRNLVSAFTSPAMRIITDPNDNQRGNVQLWLAFDTAQTGLRHRFVHRAGLPSFGGGQLAIQLFALGPQAGTDPAPPARDPAAAPGLVPLGGRHRPTDRAALERRMRQDGVTAPAHLLKHKYLIRMGVYRAGGTDGRRSEVIVQMARRPAAVLGIAWSDHRQAWGAQLGAASACKAVPRHQNPYWGGGGEAAGGTTYNCPVHYNGLGWRNLVGAFTDTRVMLVTAPSAAQGGNQLLWLGFDAPEDGFGYQAPAGDARGQVSAEKFVVGAAGDLPGWDGGAGAGPPAAAPPKRSPAPPTAPAGDTLRGQHVVQPRATLHQAILRDGFTNPDYLLAHRYLVRLEVSAEGQSAETVLRLGAIPRRAVGQGRAASGSRSAVQAGVLARCRPASGQGMCPLHYAGLGWRDLGSGLADRQLFVRLIPGGADQTASTVLWLAFDAPEPALGVERLADVAGRARVQVQRYSH
jgi:hypothetical protein